MRLIIVVRILQLLIIVVLWLATAYFGGSCFDPAGLHHGPAGKRHSYRIMRGEIRLSSDV